MLLPRPRHGIGVAVLVALALVFCMHAPVSGAEREAAAPAGAFAADDLGPIAPAAVAESAAPDVEAPIVTRSFVALLALPHPKPRSIELTLKRVDPPVTRRPAALPVLYASYAALQALDFASTRQGLSSGAREANPLVRAVTSSNAGLIAVKAGAAAGTVFLSERMWKKNPAAAIGMMIALNSAYAMVVANNYRVVRSLK